MSGLRGEELRQVIRQLCMVPMPAPVPPPEERFKQSDSRPRAGGLSYVRTEAMKITARKAQITRREEMKNNRPAGHVTRAEGAELLCCSLRYFNTQMMRNGIVAEKTNTVAWYSLEAMRRAGLILTALLAVLPVASASPLPEVGCVELVPLRKNIQRYLGEMPVGRGITQTGNLIEMFVHPEGEGFTIIRYPAGARMGCIIASGDTWRFELPGKEI